jgi:UDP-N-acetylmuramyl pentapeptide synthase
VVTGINEAHLEKFKTLEKSTDTIFELADFVKADNLYINAENNLARQRANQQNHLYSKKGVDNWVIRDIRLTVKGTKFTAQSKDKDIHVDIKLLGAHQIGPLVACVDIADKLGMAIDDIQNGIKKIQAFEHRLQPEYRDDGTIWIDDTYNGNPDGVSATIDFLKTLKNHRIIYVTPGLVEMGERSKQVHTTIGERLSKTVDIVILIRNSVTPWIEQGLKVGKFKGKTVFYEDALSCYNSLPSITKSGDIIVLQNDWPDNYA